MFAQALSLALLAAPPATAPAQAAPTAPAPAPAAQAPAAAQAPVPMVLPSQCEIGGAMRVLGEAAPVRAAPSDSAEIKVQLRAGIALCVLPGESRGYLRVVLADGRSGYLRGNSLAAEGTPPTAEVEPPARAVEAPRIKVNDLDQLALLVKEDPASVAQANKLLKTRKAATWTMAGAGAVALAGVVVGFVDPWKCQSSAAFTCDQVRSSTATTVMVTSLAIGVAGAVVGAVLYPGDRDLNAVIAGYNGRHGPPELELAGTTAAAAAVPVK